jgi:hypothetical protein
MPEPEQTLVQRAEAYVNKDIIFVNIADCVPGSNARAVKPGGVSNLVDSITEDGYKLVSLVHCLLHAMSPSMSDHSNHVYPPVALSHVFLPMSSVGVHDKCEATVRWQVCCH